MIVAISMRNEPNKYGSLTDNLENNYVDYFEKFGIKLLFIPNSTKDIEGYFSRFNVKGIILSGGNDVDPKLYGEKIDGLNVSEKRDSVEKTMLETGIDKKLPVLGICRGMQFINVFFKGKLVKNLKKELGEIHVAVNHTVKMKTSVLGREIKVNSYHNQGIVPEKLASDLRIFAQADGKVIEGIYHPLLPIAGIQWHPERESPDNEVNSKIIRCFLERRLFWKR